jgi:hypothetical protein
MKRAQTLTGGFTRSSPAIMLLVLFCCVARAGAQTQTGKENVVAEVLGRVEVKRAGWNNFVPAAMGMLVKNGDLFKLTEKARAKVLCADLSVLVIREPSRRVDCGTAKPVLYFKGSRYRPPRAGLLIAAFPVLISPRMTKLLDPRPTLRWLPVSGVTTYRVSIMHGMAEYWGQEVRGATNLKYPESAPALVAGETYKVVVTANGRNSNEEGLVNLGFALLDREQAQAVREVEGKIRALNLPEATTKFLIANLYATWGVDTEDPRDDRWALNAEAIELLEEASAVQPDPAVLRMLGDLYLTLGLTPLAEERYTRAKDLSEAAHDAQGKALAQYALARIFKVRFNKAEAKKWLQNAKESFQSFGDAEWVERIGDELSELERWQK